MSDKKEKKGLNVGAYAVVAGVLVAVVLVALTIYAFATTYTAFSPKKTAQYYADVVVQNGDGYNSYKNTLVSKNQKYGDFVIDAYMAPYVNKTAEKNKEIGTGSKAEADMLNTVYETMYDYYVELMDTVGLDDYDAFYTSYFAKLKQVRVDVIGDEFMDTEFMFGVFESNVDTFGKSLTGTEVEYQADGKTVKTPAQTGKYQELFGDDYKLTTAVIDTVAITGDDLSAYIAGYKDRVAPLVDGAKAKAEQFGLAEDASNSFVDAYAKLDCSEDISEVDACTVSVTLEDGTEVANLVVYVVKIGNSWYVDNTNVDTSVLYLS